MEKVYEAIAKGVVEGIKLFEEEVVDSIALESILEEANVEPVDLLESMLADEEVSREAQPVEESKQEEAIEESTNDFDKALDQLLAEFAEE